MAIIQSGSTATLWTIDPVSSAGRVTIYDQYGNSTGDVNSLNNVLNGLNANVTMTLSGHATLGLAITTTSGSLTLSFEGTIDGYTWFALSAAPITGGSTITSTTNNGQWIASTSGMYAVRARVSTFSSGSMTVSLIITPNNSAASAQVITGTVTTNQGIANSLSGAWPVEITDGTNLLGVSAHPLKIDPTGTTIQPISGTIVANAGTGSFTVAQTTAANLNATVTGSVSITGSVATTQSGTWTIQPGNTANTTPWLATINQGGNSAIVTAGNALKIDGSAVIQPISGTVTANAGTGIFGISGTVTSNIGTTNGLALDTTLTGGSQTTRLTDGTNVASVKAASIAAATTDKALVVAISPNNSIAVTGTFFQATQPVSGTITANAGTGTFDVSGTVATTQSGTWTNAVTQTTASNLNATVVGSGNFTVTQATASNLNATVSGTVSSNQNGTWTVQPGNTANTTPWLNTINQGGNSATVKAASTLATATDTSLVVALNPASAAPKSSSATVAQIASANTSTTLLAANSNRLGALIVNASTQILYIKFGTGAATTSFTAPVPISNGMFEVPFGYTGIITGVWAGVNGFAYCTECIP